MQSIVVKGLNIYKVYMNGKYSEEERKKNVIDFILSEFNILATSDIILIIKKRLNQGFYNNLNAKVKELKKNKKPIQLFESKFSSWLNKDFVISMTTGKTEEADEPASKRGRPSTEYNSACTKTQKNVVRDIAESMPDSALFETSSQLLKESGNKSGSKLFDIIVKQKSSSPLLQKLDLKASLPMTPAEALALFIDMNLTKSSYIKMRDSALQRNNNLYPLYKHILEAKTETYPENILVTELTSEVPLLDLLRHTVKHILQFLKFPSPRYKSSFLTMKLKYGFDGTSSSAYKQRWKNGFGNDEHLFCSSLVPLQLIDDEHNNVLWDNPSPSSTRFCRPIRIQFAKETSELIKTEELYIKAQIENLKEICVGKFKVKIDMALTMIDGKVCCVLNDTSNQCCHICGATISEMNNVNLLSKKIIKESALEYGIPVLHAHIRLLECVLHIFYRLDLKKWRVSKDLKLLLNEKKMKIQKLLHEELGIKVDAPKQGFGSTNDGNTARIFFKNYVRVAEIRGFDKSLLEKFQTILGVLSSRQAINISAFKTFCIETTDLYISLYKWYYMPPSLHIILMHGHLIIKKAVFPIGIFSEEAQECRNKDIKRFRELYSRKMSRVQTNMDTFKRLLLTSDPLISMGRSLEKRKGFKSTEAMKRLLEVNTPNTDFSNEDE